MASLTQFAGGFLSDLLPMSVDVGFRRGWREDESLQEALERQRDGDRRLGYTRPGPHRADLELRVHGAQARTVLSRGESKLLAMGLLLAQAAYFTVHRGEAPVVLVDDLGMELDQANQQRFVRALRSIGAQAFVTTVLSDAEAIFPPEIAGTSRITAFHVEQGEFRQMV